MSSTVVVPKVGMKVGYDSLRGAVPAKIREIFKTKFGALWFKLEALGGAEAQLSVDDNGYRKGQVFDVEACSCAPFKNFRWRGYNLYWIPVDWRTP